MKDAAPEARSAAETEAETEARPEAEIVATFPCTPAQARFWFVDQLQPGSASSNIAVQWELRGSFTHAAVEAAFQAVIDRHEILRTRFVERDGMPVQEVLDAVPVRLGVIDVRSLPEAEREARIAQIVRDLCTRPFDLRTPCALRMALVRFAPDRARLLLAAHHAVFDGFSIRVLGRELGAALAAGPEAEAPPPLPVQYGDYTQWLAACRETEAHAAAAAFWRDALDGMEYFELPPDRPHQPLAQRRGARVTLPLPADFFERLDGAARRAGTSPFAFGAAVFAAALHRFTGREDISFGTAVAGRSEPELEALIGVFINPVVLRLGLSGQTPLATAVAQAQPRLRAALAEGDYPFDDLVRDLRLRGDDRRTPAVSVYFALQKVFLEEQRHGEVEIRSVPSTTPEITHDLNMQIIGRCSGWQMMADYDADRFDAATVTRLCRLLERCFDLAIAGDARPLADLPMPEAPTKPAAAPQPARLAVVPAPAPAPEASEAVVDRLATIWGEVLGHPPAACDGDFFDLGGGSLLALRMMARVQEAFGVRPDIADFLRASSLRGTAAKIEALLGAEADETRPASWSMIELAEGAPDRPLIVTVNQPFLYDAMARRLEAGQGLVNLHLQGTEALEPCSFERLETLSGEAAETLQREAAGREVILAGQCVDGAVALMIARAMAASGAPPALLCMIDSWRPGVTAPAGLSGRIFRLRRKLRRWGLYAGQRLRGRIGWAEFVSKSARGRDLLVRLGRLEAPTEVEWREWAVNHLLQAAVAGAPALDYAGEVLMFRTESQRHAARDTLFGWAGHLPADTPVHDLPGWHEDALLKHGIGRIVEVLGCRAARLVPGPGATAGEGRAQA